VPHSVPVNRGCVEALRAPAASTRTTGSCPMFYAGVRR
jgi:hypothetical protein